MISDGLLARHGVVRRIELDHPADLAHVVLVLPVDGVEVRLTTDAVWRTDREEAGDVVAELAAAVVHRSRELSTAVHRSN